MDALAYRAPLTERQPAAPPVEPRSDGQPYASPHVRRLAREQGVDLPALARALPAGRVRRTDLPGPTPQPLRQRPSIEVVTGPKDLCHAQFDLDAGSAAEGAELVASLVVAAVAALRTAMPAPATTVQAQFTDMDSSPIRQLTIGSIEDLDPDGVGRRLTSSTPTDPGPAGAQVQVVSGLPCPFNPMPLEGNALLAIGLTQPREQVVAIGTPASIAVRTIATVCLTVDATALDVVRAGTMVASIMRRLERLPR